jgi:hypothetical protein
MCKNKKIYYIYYIIKCQNDLVKEIADPKNIVNQ